MNALAPTSPVVHSPCGRADSRLCVNGSYLAGSPTPARSSCYVLRTPVDHPPCERRNRHVDQRPRKSLVGTPPPRHPKRTPKHRDCTLRRRQLGNPNSNRPRRWSRGVWAGSPAKLRQAQCALQFDRPRWDRNSDCTPKDYKTAHRESIHLAELVITIAGKLFSKINKNAGHFHPAFIVYYGLPESASRL